MEPQTVLEIYRKDSLQDISSLKNDYKEYLEILIDVTNSLSESQTQMPFYKIKIEMLLVKFTLSAKTLISIIDGTRLDSKYFSKDLTLPDIPSIHIICRALFENYLTIFYLFFDEKHNENIVQYRNLPYELSSLCKRQEAPVRSPEQELKKKQEAQVIKMYRQALDENEEFHKLNEKRKRKILNSNRSVPSKVYTWTKLFDLCPLNKDVFLKSWGVYSNYAHSEYLSIMQLENMFKSPTSFNFFVFQGLKAQVLLIAQLITELSNLFPCTTLNLLNARLNL